MIDPLLEQSMLEAMRPSEDGPHIALDPHRLEAVVASTRAALETAGPGPEPVLVCAPSLRSAVRRLISSQTDGLPVLSYTEATAGGLAIDTVGVVRDTVGDAQAITTA
jgi:flagellar biosynthesis protein FlhA